MSGGMDMHRGTKIDFSKINTANEINTETTATIKAEAKKMKTKKRSYNKKKWNQFLDEDDLR